jgi:DNA polymerase-3 subunit beta
MKIIINTHEYKAAMEKHAKVLPKKSYVCALHEIFVHVADDHIRLTAANFEQFASTTISASIIDADDETRCFGISDTKVLLKGIKFFSSDDTTLEITKDSVIIVCGGKKIKQSILPGSDCIEFPVLDAEKTNKATYSANALDRRFEAVKYAAKTDDNGGALTGICFNKNDMVAVDGYRLALNRDASLNFSSRFVVPVNALVLAGLMLDNNITIETDEKFIQFSDGSTILISRLLAGDFFNYETVMEPKVEETQITVNVKNFSDGLKYLKTFSNKQFIVNWHNSQIGMTQSTGWYESDVAIQGDMGEEEICFNGHYLLDALARYKGSAILHVVNNLAPLRITSDTDIENEAVLLLVRPKERMFPARHDAAVEVA